MNAWSRKGACQSGVRILYLLYLGENNVRVAKPSEPWGRGKHSDRVMPAAVSVPIHLGQTARGLLRRLTAGAAAMGKRRDARRAAAHRLVQAGAAQAEAASHVAFRSPKWQLTFFHAVEGGEHLGPPARGGGPPCHSAGTGSP